MQEAAQIFSESNRDLFFATYPAQVKQSFSGMVSGCEAMQKVFSVIQKIAKTKSTVLVLGESGTGKELVAQAIHRLSMRTGKLVPVNCGAIPEEILESELFGHEKGSFTGAVANRIGRFQMADSGTIFLDEIGEMSPKLQVKLLRVLQERKVDPVGSNRSIDIDVRVIAATNKDLMQEVKAGRFREDLFYRLQVLPVELPALRNRLGDVGLLVEHFLKSFASENGMKRRRLTASALAVLENYSWPGNIRELENVIERISVLSDQELIDLDGLPEYLFDKTQVIELPVSLVSEMPFEGVDFNSLIDDYESRLIMMALQRTNGNKKAAAKLLQLNRTTLVEKIKKKGIASDEPEGLEA